MGDLGIWGLVDLVSGGFNDLEIRGPRTWGLGHNDIGELEDLYSWGLGTRVLGDSNWIGHT